MHDIQYDGVGITLSKASKLFHNPCMNCMCLRPTVDLRLESWEGSEAVAVRLFSISSDSGEDQAVGYEVAVMLKHGRRAPVRHGWRSCEAKVKFMVLTRCPCFKDTERSSWTYCEEC